MTIQDHINKNIQELNDPLITRQRRRHLQSELDDLEVYHQHHPQETKDPTSLELFCDLNPDDVQCRVYNV